MATSMHRGSTWSSSRPSWIDFARPKDRALRLERFIDPQQLDPVRFTGRSLYLLPDGLAAQHAYDLL